MVLDLQDDNTRLSRQLRRQARSGRDQPRIEGPA
jgi:hypothetical protein